MATNIQTYCKSFRENTLHKTLDDIHEITDVNIKTLSAFEHGRSNNIRHLQHYVNACDTEQQILMFQIGLVKELTKTIKKSAKE